MPTMKLKATKMHDAKVSYISLVERGANRIPFKIVKKEKGMAGNSAFAGLDLANLFTRKAEKPVKVEVVGIVTMKDERLDSIKEQLEANGFDIAKQTEMEDGSVVFKQGDTEMDGEGQVVRISDHIALVTKGFNPYLMNMAIGDQTFEQVCKAQGFYPGIGTVMDVLRTSVMQFAAKSEDPSAATDAIDSMFDEAKAYVVQMVSTMPASAFKTETIEPVADLEEKLEENEVVKGAPFGNDNAAGPHKGGGSSVKDGLRYIGSKGGAVNHGGQRIGNITPKDGAFHVKHNPSGDETNAKTHDEAMNAMAGMHSKYLEMIAKEELEEIAKSADADCKDCKPGEKCKTCGKETPAMKEGEVADEVCKGCGGKKKKEGVTAKEDEKVCVCTEVAPVVAEKVEEQVVETKKEEVVVPPVVQGLTQEQVSAIVTSQVTTVAETLTQKMEQLISGLTDTMKKSIEGVEAKVTAVETVAKSANETVASIVVGGGNNDDQDAVKKADQPVFGREIDTAYNPGVRTRRR